MILQDLPRRQFKLARGLKQSKSIRFKNKCFLVEGIKTVSEALNSDYDIELIVVSEQFLERSYDILDNIMRQNPEIYFYKVSDKMFNEISDTVTPQGILAMAKFKHVELEDIFRGNFLMFGMDRIKDPGNMGTIIRTADAASASAVVVGKGCVDVYNPKVIRATMGSIFHIPIIYVEDFIDSLLKIKKNGGQIVTTHLEAQKYYYDVDFKKPTIVVMGMEDDGVLENIVRISDEVAKIPMPGKAESLNVAIAHGVIAFEAVKQRT